MSSVQQVTSGYVQKNNLTQNKREQVFFKQEPMETKEKPKEENKNNFGRIFKNGTNIAGVAAWLFVVGYSLKKLKLLQPKSPERIADKAKKLKKQTLNCLEKASDPEHKIHIKNALDGTSQRGLRNAIYKTGEAFQAAIMRMGEELFNNVTYAFGTLVVMPTVILCSPFGKKESSKEDKFFTVLRQPISVAATLGMQFTFDKLIGKYAPEVLKSNHFEDKSILDKNGKIRIFDEKGQVIRENLDKIIYNTDSAKEGFKKLAKENLTDEEIVDLFTLRSFESEGTDTYSNKLKDILNKKYKQFGLHLEDLKDKAAIDKLRTTHAEKAADVEKLLATFKKFTRVLDKNTITITKFKILTNVIFASAIGCTFLNVVYGKFMMVVKKYKEQRKQNAAKNKEVK